MKKIIVTKKPAFKFTYDMDDLAELCLNICGGGLTVSQTAQAIELQTTVKTAGKATKNGYTLTLQS